MKTMLAAANTLGRIDGSVILRNRRSPRQPRLRAGLLHLGVEAGQRRLHVEVDDRVEVQRGQRRRPRRSARRAASRSARSGRRCRAFEQRVERAGAPEQLLHPDGADERRDHERQRHQRGQQPPAGKVEAVEQQRRADADRARDGGAEHGDRERVAQPLEVDRVAEHGRDVGERQPAAAVDEGAAHALGERPQQQRGQQRADDGDRGDRRARGAVSPVHLVTLPPAPAPSRAGIARGIRSTRRIDQRASSIGSADCSAARSGPATVA